MNRAAQEAACSLRAIGEPLKMSDPLPPRWDLSQIFPSLDSPEFTAAFEQAGRDLESLAAQFDSLGIRRLNNPSVDSQKVAAYEQLTALVNDLYEHNRTLAAYARCIASTYAR